MGGEGEDEDEDRDEDRDDYVGAIVYLWQG